MKRTRIERRAALERHRPIRPVSSRRRKRDASYPAARRAVYDRADGLCEVPPTDGLLCGDPMVDVHHIAGREGPDPHRLDNLVGLCRWHHDLVHANPEWARFHGLMKSRHGGNA